MEYCGEIGRMATCENGHQYLKILYCGKEWCKNCRDIMHRRRQYRWLPKALQMKSFGYFVFTIPLELRDFYKEAKNLTQLRSYLRRRLKQIYPDIKALCRWHWFGENARVYHPHLNVMIDSFEKLPKEELERIKEDYKSALERFTGIKLNRVVVYYQYCSPSGFKKMDSSLSDEQAQILYQKAFWHKLRYITRATFLRYNKELAEKLKNYRNSSVWGRFDSELDYDKAEALAKVKEATCKDHDLLLIEKGYCPLCGADLHWSRKFVPGCISEYGKEIGLGYYFIQIKIRGSPKLPSKEELEKIRHYRHILYEQAIDDSKWKNRVDIYG